MENSLSSSILTSTGKWFDILTPNPSFIDLRDIASALSKLCRFGGHCKQFYSVAEHSLLVAKMMRQRNRNSSILIRWALLHDASEAYVVDIPRPAKRQLSEYMKIEDKIQRTIAERYGLPWPMPHEVHEADSNILSLELRAYMLEQPEHMLPPLPTIGLADGLPAKTLSPRMAERAFLKEAKALEIV